MVPNQMRYQTALRPDAVKVLQYKGFFSKRSECRLGRKG